jgi:hypothetical protein
MWSFAGYIRCSAVDAYLYADLVRCCKCKFVPCKFTRQWIYIRVSFRFYVRMTKDHACPACKRPLYKSQDINLSWMLMNLNNSDTLTVEYVLLVYSAFGIVRTVRDIDDYESDQPAPSLLIKVISSSTWCWDCKSRADVDFVTCFMINCGGCLLLPSINQSEEFIKETELLFTYKSIRGIFHRRSLVCRTWGRRTLYMCRLFFL